MKKLLIAVLLSAVAFYGNAQKYACVDTEYILSNVPEYKQAQKEVEAKFQTVDKLYKAFQAEAVLLPADLKTQKENEIIAAEKDAKNLQKRRFGNDGDLTKKRSELVKPIQDRIYNAIEKVAREKNYSVVFDKSGGATILYVESKTDISDLVLAELGYKINSSKR